LEKEFCSLNHFFPGLERWSVQLVQGGVTEEQMLKHLGANTTLMPKEAARLLEVCTSCIIISVNKLINLPFIY
jgi:hypothetical protein